MRPTQWLLGLLMMLAALLISAPTRGEEVSYNRDIRPLLADRCFACHGPDESKREAKLRLDVANGEQSPFAARDGRRVIQPKEAESSELWKRLTTDDPDLQMPPADSIKKPLTDAQKELIKRWIQQGAAYENFWSFVPPTPQPVPDVINDQWPSSRIDRFVLAKLDSQQVRPQSQADKRTLIRRVTLDLTGLPPTRQAIHEFEADESPDAYERLVDRLLAMPQYGEHMARYWLDLVRYADTNGMHHDHYRELSQYRDWVIRAFNANMPFDEFTTNQLAGDLMDNATLDQQIASGYNRLHMVMDRGTNPPLESYTRNVVDQVSAFGTVFMGLTLECSVCHDHKYDPVKQRDFYQLFAFFNNIDGDPETPGRDQQPPILELPTDEQVAGLKELDSQIAAVQQNEEERKQLKAARDDLQRNIPIALVMKERADVRPAYILKRGAYDQPGEEVSRNTPAFLPPLEAQGSLPTRRDLARWVTDKQNPLTARVTVNRFWQQFFGVGLVKTSADFGAQGEYPTHPELLDELANTFVASGWDIKGLVRAIVLSQTYRQSSSVSPEQYRADAENRLLARGSRIRLDSEVIRDQILAVSGLLNGTMYGKSVKPPQPADLWKTVSMVSSSTYSFKEDTGDKIYRRSFYTFWKRAMPPPQMTIFDAPTRESCTSRRERTNTPVQALLLMNEAQYFEAARHFAQQLLECEGDDSARLRVAFESITAQRPDTEEHANLQRGLDGFRAVYKEDREAAQAMTSSLAKASEAERVELAALTMVINAIFNLDAAKTRE